MSSDERLFNPFPGNGYDTPERVHTSLFAWSRLACYLPVFGTYVKSGMEGKNGQLDGEHQIRNSLSNIRVVEHLGGKVHLRGLDHLDAVPGPCVIISNHMSLLETAVLHAFLRPRKDFCFIVKESLFSVPWFRHILLSMKCIGVTRNNPREDFRAVMEKGGERLNADVSVVVFPQSTRSDVFDPASFSTLGVKLAKSAGVPVIPCALRTDFVGNGRFLKDLGPIRRNNPVWFSFGEPVSVTGNGKEAHEACLRFITSALKEWGCPVKE